MCGVEGFVDRHMGFIWFARGYRAYNRDRESGFASFGLGLGLGRP